MSQNDRPRALEDVVATVRDIVAEVCGFSAGELGDDQQIAHLDIDSVLAAEILSRIERDLDVDIDIRLIVDDWSSLTLRDLARQVMAGLDK